MVHSIPYLQPLPINGIINKMTKESKEFMKELYIICVFGMFIIALFYIIIIPDLEAYSESKTVYKCNNRVGNYNCFDKPIHREKKPKTLDDIYKQLEDENG